MNAHDDDEQRGYRFLKYTSMLSIMYTDERISGFLAEEKQINTILRRHHILSQILFVNIFVTV